MPKLTIGLVLPDVLGTYGDDGNALVLRERARRRGIDASIERIMLHDDVPPSCDLYTLGGGEDSAQLLAAARLSASPGLQAAAADGRPIFAVCAGLQVLGPDASALGRVTRGVGNGADGEEKVDGVVQGSVIATYMHGPALARNPQLADLLIARALDIPLAELEPLELDAVTKLREERLR